MKNDQKTSFFLRPKITLTKGKESKARKTKGEERRKTAESKGCALSLNHIGYFTSFLNKENIA